MKNLYKKAIIILTVVFIAVAGVVITEGAQAMTNALNSNQQSIVAISAFTANGDLEKLKTALNEGLYAGLTVNEIKEVLVQLYAYTGFPRSLNGISTFMGVMDERQKKGIKDEIGKEANPFPADKSVFELGSDIQTRLVGSPVTGPLFEFAPTIDLFLKDHLFGDIFGRDNLDWQSREIATIAALASVTGVDSQLQAHFTMGMNTGLTAEQMKSLVLVLESKIGKTETARASAILERVIVNRR